MYDGLENSCTRSDPTVWGDRALASNAVTGKEQVPGEYLLGVSQHWEHFPRHYDIGFQAETNIAKVVANLNHVQHQVVPKRGEPRQGVRGHRGHLRYTSSP